MAIVTEINFVKDVEDLKLELGKANLSQAKFAEAYFQDEVNPDASEHELVSHYERFKKLLNTDDRRSPERTAAYVNYFNRRFKTDGKFTQADRWSAWEMYIELDTRIATRSLSGGSLQAALISIAALFSLHREIAKKYGPNCRYYYDEVTASLEEHVRPFTSKWHGNDSIDKDAFLAELEAVQNHLEELKAKLFEIAG